jgi:hypothetical protein
MNRNNKSIEFAKQLVNDLYDFRDNYFNRTDLKCFDNKEIDVQNKLQVIHLLYNYY